MISSPDDLALLDAFAVRASGIDVDLGEAGLIDLLDTIERDKSALAAVQVLATVALDARTRERQAAAGTGIDTQGRGVGTQVGLARQEAPDAGRRLLALSKILVQDMPLTMRALTRGAISETRALVIAAEAQGLSSALRPKVDAAVQEHPGDFTGEGVKQLANRVKAQEVDPRNAVAKAAAAARKRRISFIPEPDAMMRVTGMVPVEMGLIIAETLESAVATKVAAGDGRTRELIRVDEFFERLTGAKSDHGVPVTINLVMTDRTLFQSESEPVQLQGYGAMPAAWARWIVTGPKGESTVKCWVRRIFTAPRTGSSWPWTRTNVFFHRRCAS